MLELQKINAINDLLRQLHNRQRVRAESRLSDEYWTGNGSYWQRQLDIGWAANARLVAALRRELQRLQEEAKEL